MLAQMDATKLNAGLNSEYPILLFAQQARQPRHVDRDPPGFIAQESAPDFCRATFTETCNRCPCRTTSFTVFPRVTWPRRLAARANFFWMRTVIAALVEHVLAPARQSCGGCDRGDWGSRIGSSAKSARGEASLSVMPDRRGTEEETVICPPYISRP
jgi:hypothetical protein